MDDDEQVVAAADEVAADDLVEFGDALRDAVEPAAAFRGDADFDEGGDGVLVESLAVDDGLVAADHAVLLEGGNAGVDLVDGEVQLAREVLAGRGGVLLQEAEQGFHKLTAKYGVGGGGWQDAGLANGARRPIFSSFQADVAQLVEQLIRNQQVTGSSPVVGSIFRWR